MLEEQTSRPHRSLDFPLAVLIFEPKQDEDMVSVHPKRILIWFKQNGQIVGRKLRIRQKIEMSQPNIFVKTCPAFASNQRFFVNVYGY